MDIWGPYTVESITRARYFLIIIDVFNRCTQTFLLQNKSHATLVLKQFFVVVKTQFKSRITMIRYDNGTKFIQSTCLDLFSQKGVLHQRCIVKTPQQNGVVERKHRNLLEIASVGRFQARFPKNYWGECILPTMHIINKLPIANLSQRIPFEILHNKPPTCEDLGIMGCLCLSRKQGEQDKFEPKGIRCVLLGYTLGFERYKLYDLETHKNFIIQISFLWKLCFPSKLNQELRSTLLIMVPQPCFHIWILLILIHHLPSQVLILFFLILLLHIYDSKFSFLLSFNA